LRRLWAGETVSHEGAAGTFRDVKLSPLPVQQPLEVWLGGTAAAALERCGRLSDGWLPSQCTPDEAAAGRVVIEEAAAKAGRSISSEHFGMSIGYARVPIDPATARVMAARRPRSVELTPVGLPAVRALIERFVAVGFSKFVLRPVVPPASWRAELEALSGAVGGLQTWATHALRRDRRRRRVRGALRAAPPARARVVGPRARSGRRDRRHLVLEPLSGRALRRREHGLLLLVLRRAAAGVALDRALRVAAGNPDVHQPR